MALKKYRSKYYLKKEFETLITGLYEIKKNYQLFKVISSGDNHKILCENFPHTFSIILKALLDKTIVGIFKYVYDKDSKSITVTDILKIYVEDSLLFKEKNYYYATDIVTGKRVRRTFDKRDAQNCIDVLKKDLAKYKNIETFMKTYRNKFVAHCDKKYNFDSKIKVGKAKVKYDEIEAFIDLIITDVNNLYNCVFGITYACHYEELKEMKDIAELIQKGIGDK